MSCRTGISTALSKIFTGIYLALILNIKLSSGWWTNSGVRVSNARLQPQINGLYYLTSHRCHNYEVWAEDTSSRPHYISYIKTWNESGTEFYYWAIGTTVCVVQPNITALNRLDGAKSKPYDLPTVWLELFNSTSRDFVPNKYLIVEEVYYLSVGEIIGVILGCLCLGLLLLALNVFICSKINEHKRRRTSPSSTSVPERYNRRGDRSRRREEGLTLPPSYSPGVFIIPVEPPQYDNQPPPSYETIQLQKRLEESSEYQLPPYSLCVTGLDDGLQQCGTAPPVGSMPDGVYQQGGGVSETSVAASISSIAEMAVISQSSDRDGVVILNTPHLGGVTATQSIAATGEATDGEAVSTDAEGRVIDITECQSANDNARIDQRSLTASEPASTTASRLINAGVINHSYIDDISL